MKNFLFEFKIIQFVTINQKIKQIQLIKQRLVKASDVDEAKKNLLYFNPEAVILKINEISTDFSTEEPTA